MKFMETINEIQALFTRLRREIQREEAPKCTCPSPTVYPHGGDCPVHGKDTWSKTARECTCVSGVVGEDCPLHGTAGETLEDQIRRCNKAIVDGYAKKLNQEMMNELKAAGECTDPPWLDDCKKWMDKVRSDRERRDLGGKPTPDLPLNAKVAKALGKEIEWVTSIPDHHWKIYKDRCWQLIPDYDKHIDLAMGALEEYAQKIDKFWQAKLVHSRKRRDNDFKVEHLSYRVTFNYQEDNDTNQYSTLPQAICEAIVAHAEGK